MVLPAKCEGFNHERAHGLSPKSWERLGHGHHGKKDAAGMTSGLPTCLEASGCGGGARVRVLGFALQPHF